MNIHIVIVAYALANELGNLLRELATPNVTFHLHLHSSNSLVENVCSHAASDNPNVIYHPHRVNRGLARSWNDGLFAAYAQGADVVIIANDDIHAGLDDLLFLAEAAVANRDYGIVEVVGSQYGQPLLMNFGFCAVNPILLEKVGYFDCNFFPIYFEDSDLSRRCTLLGMPLLNAGNSNVVHLGSSTIGALPELKAQNQVTFRANHEYYVRKHGGPPGAETFMSPFNNPALSWVIGAENREHPYPGYDRVDMEIVKI